MSSRNRPTVLVPTGRGLPQKLPGHVTHVKLTRQQFEAMRDAIMYAVGVTGSFVEPHITTEERNQIHSNLNNAHKLLPVLHEWPLFFAPRPPDRHGVLSALQQFIRECNEE